MKNKEEFLIHMQQHPFYPVFVEQIKRQKPLIPDYDPVSDNTEMWKFLSAQAKGYELACSIFNIKME